MRPCDSVTAYSYDPRVNAWFVEYFQFIEMISDNIELRFLLV